MLKQTMIALTGAAAISLGFTGTASAAVFEFSGRYYGFVDGSFSWNEAFQDAADKGGYLLTITSQEEQDFINTTFDPGTTDGTVPDQGWGWIGLSDEGDEGNFTWRNGPEAGTSITFTNWAGGEPNNAGGNGEDYVHLDNRPNRTFGTWNDWVASAAGNGLGYYIEYDTNPEAVPEPASMLGLLAVGAIAAGGAIKRKVSA